jgi:hypothetical protein
MAEKLELRLDSVNLDGDNVRRCGGMAEWLKAAVC